MDFVLSQVVKGGPPISIDEKVEKAGEMLGFIAKLPSGIERDHYLKRTAEALDLDEGVLRQEMPTQAKRLPGSPAGEKAAATVRVRRPRAEEILIHLILKDEEIALSLKDQIRPEDFTDPLYQRAAKKYLEVLDANGRLDISAMLTGGDEELNRLIAHYSVLEMEYEDPHKHCRDCLDLIKQRDPEKKIKLLYKAIQEAEMQGDSETVARLMEEQQTLSRRPGRKIPGR